MKPRSPSLQPPTAETTPTPVPSKEGNQRPLPSLGGARGGLADSSRRLRHLSLRALLLGLGVACSAAAADNPTLAQLTAPGSQIKLPGMTIHGGDQKFVEVDGTLSLTNGILEFIAVEPGGRDYESLFTANCKPSALQFALFLIGCESGPLPRLAKSGEKTGDRLAIEVEWQRAGQPTRVPIETFLRQRKDGKTARDLQWIFTGSYFAKRLTGDGEIYMADSEQAHIALWWNQAVLINLGGDYGNPYQADDQGFDVNPAPLPPEKTPIKLIFRKAVNK